MARVKPSAVPLCAGSATQSIPLAWYVVSLLLNFCWTPLFFVLHRPDLALLDITGKAEHAAVTARGGHSLHRTLSTQRGGVQHPDRIACGW